MKKSAQLVCQHLENIPRKVLEKHQEIIRQYVRGRHGIYALYRRNKFYYVGLATDLRKRLKNHLKDRHGHSWDRFSLYFTIGDNHLRELESLILRTVKPSGNKQKGKFAKSEDIRRRFKRSCMAEVSDLFGESHPSRRLQDSRLRKVDGRTPVMAEYISGSMKLRALFKGKLYKALVKKNGTIRYAGKVYNSPSSAGRAVIKRACDGWFLWKYQRAPGDWVKLHTLRS